MNGYISSYKKDLYKLYNRLCNRSKKNGVAGSLTYILVLMQDDWLALLKMKWDETL